MRRGGVSVCTQCVCVGKGAVRKRALDRGGNSLGSCFSWSPAVKGDKWELGISSWTPQQTHPQFHIKNPYTVYYITNTLPISSAVK